VVLLLLLIQFANFFCGLDLIDNIGYFKRVDGIDRIIAHAGKFQSSIVNSIYYCFDCCFIVCRRMLMEL